ncbi:unnamed protein product [Clonostachys solani]|uniref:CHAT domain-containing protein n=1 Tax=Clonostachys solani TaxID=160281 RepID=A0A9P0ES28_9HYPO|nr:unnamed protein product [Clonostachys solani]
MSESLEPTQGAQTAADVAARSRADLADQLSDTALRSFTKYYSTFEFSDLEEALRCTEEALKSIPHDHPEYLGHLSNIVSLFSDKFDTTGRVVDLENAIQFGREAIDRFPENLNRGYLLNAVADKFDTLFASTGEVSAQDLSVQYAKDAYQETSDRPENEPFRLEVMDTLCTVLMTRYQRIWDLQDLEQAIEIARSVRCFSQNGYLEHSIRLSDHLISKYLRVGEVASLEEAKTISREALLFAAVDDADYPGCVFSLARSLYLSSQRTSELSELEGAIQYLRSVEKFLAEDDCESISQYLSSLANCLDYKYSITGQPSQLEEAIQLMRRAVDITDPETDRYAGILCQISVLLGQRYSRAWSMDDLIESIGYGEEAVNASLPSDPNLPAFMTSLGNRFMERYLRTGKVGYMDKAIELSRDALKKSPEGHPAHVAHVTCLSHQLGERYSRFGMMADLEEAIQLVKETLSLGSLGNSDRAKCFTAAALRFGDKYLRTNSLPDLEESVRYAKRALDELPEEHSHRAAYSSNLAEVLRSKYQETNVMSDLEESLHYGRQAVRETPPGNADEAGYFNNLAFQLAEKYRKTREPEILAEAISYATKAVTDRPEEYQYRAMYLSNLGDCLRDRHAISNSASDLEAAMQNYELALAQTSSPIINRIKAGIQILELSSAHSSWRRAFEASATAVELIPQLSMRSLENSDKQFMLGQAAGLTSDAVAAAINAGEGPLCALSLLEQGRGLIATSLEEIRTDVLELRKADPYLADAFVSLGNVLDMSEASTKQHVTTTPQVGADRRYQVDKELGELIDTIRKKDGFGNFLRAPSEVDIQDAARNGPVVAINVSKFRCDALLVENHQIRLLPLPDLHLEDIKDRELQSNLGSTAVLEWLWDTVTGPILHALGLSPVPSGENSWPHIWWIPTGPLGRFPLHASGYHQDGRSETVCDRLMSSYSASIKMMIYGRRHAATPRGVYQALMLAMENTPGATRLPFAAAEVKQAFSICQSMGLIPITPEPCKQSVLSHLSQCSIFHFAGHGFTHNTDPSKSHLLLRDGMNNPLTVSEILALNLREMPPFLAYLSACGTGRIRDEKFFDESIHLVSSFQLAGFRHVIGTLWEVQDEMCAEMATIVYEEMRDGKMSDDSVCRGLHKATRAARDHWLGISSSLERNSRAVVKRESMEAADGRACLSLPGEIRLPRDIKECAESEQFWVPYVHFGI